MVIFSQKCFTTSRSAFVLFLRPHSEKVEPVCVYRYTQHMFCFFFQHMSSLSCPNRPGVCYGCSARKTASGLLKGLVVSTRKSNTGWLSWNFPVICAASLVNVECASFTCSPSALSYYYSSANQLRGRTRDVVAMGTNVRRTSGKSAAELYVSDLSCLDRKRWLAEICSYIF